MALTLLHLLLIDVFAMKKGVAYLLMVCVSSMLFAGYHTWGMSRSSGRHLYFEQWQDCILGRFCVSRVWG